ncbi:MAG: type II secretion system ATPase GspE [Gammaproteobacteria bacterium]|nr:type II secretion system ATPase GspE [Gammaproteobacteria bacterium]
MLAPDGDQWAERIDPECVNALSYPFAKRHGVLVASKDQDRHHIVCTAAPKLDIVTELRRKLGGALQFHQTDQPTFERLLRQSYDKGQSEATQMVDDMGGELDLARLAHELPQATDLLEAAGEAPIIRLINALLTQAIREGASDIHLEAFEQRSVVRFRVDGVLRDVVEPQRALHGALVSRLKVMSRLDIAEKRLPQDGRISLRVGDHPVDVRVSTLPTQHGERVVLRLLDKQSARLDIAKLGMDDDIRREFEHLVHAPHGIVLVTGPTGSGKTTTLYAGLIRLDRDRLNILTVEDPIEYDLDGVGQTQVNAKIGLTFAGGLRSILRQDPDVVLVGEIRDLETAQIAVQASLTGHLVLSTLHTNTAIGAMTRLLDMGMESFLISSSLLGILSQRLVRRLCLTCREPYMATERELKLLGLEPGASVELHRAVGCNTCDQTGYRGRTGIYELIPVDDVLRTMIHDRKSEDEMLRYVRKTRKGIARSGYERVLRGETSIDDVLRVTLDS